jgi:hypothetical protein
MEFKITLFNLLLITTLSCKAFVTVGTDGNCDVNNLTAAIALADSDIRVTNQASITEHLIVNNEFTFTGGFNNCIDAENFTQSSTKTIWDAQNNGTALIASRDVNIGNFEFINGNGSSPSSGAIVATNAAQVVVFKSDIHDNQGTNGGAISIASADAKVSIFDVRIHHNNSSFSGGGVNCSRGKFDMLGDSAIYNNTSSKDGGGIFASNGCQLSIQSGDTLPAQSTNKGIYNNTSLRSGGGVALTGASTMLLTGNSTAPASIKANHAEINAGAILMTSAGTSVTATNALIDFNTAKAFAGAIYATSGSSFNMSRLDTSCWDNDNCSSLSNNTVQDDAPNATPTAGVGFFSGGATVNIAQTKIANNKAETSAAFKLFDAGQVTLEGNVFSNNGNTNNDRGSAELISLNDGGPSVLNFSYNTVSANDVIRVFSLINITSQQTLNINNSVIWGSATILNTTGAIAPSVFIDCNIVNEVQSLIPFTPSGTIVADPLFVNINDFHLSPGSLAIDRCDEFFVQAQNPDLNGLSRGVDEPDHVDFNGPFDAGAYEYRFNDVIFNNGFD